MTAATESLVDAKDETTKAELRLDITNAVSEVNTAVERLNTTIERLNTTIERRNATIERRLAQTTYWLIGFGAAASGLIIAVLR